MNLVDECIMNQTNEVVWLDWKDRMNDLWNKFDEWYLIIQNEWSKKECNKLQELINHLRLNQLIPAS